MNAAIYDAHNHLQDERIVGVADCLDVAGCVVNGTREEDWARVEALAKRFSWVVPSYGLHPWHVAGRSGDWLKKLRRLLEANPRACVGEIGLDRWMENPDLLDQEKVFAEQIELAVELKRPVTIHCLKAWGRLEEMLPALPCLLHSYGGSVEMVSVFAKRGAYLSFSGYFAQERKAKQREVFKHVPIERLLIETDAPDMLPPEELRVEKSWAHNDPRNIARIYEYAAGLFEMPVAEFAGQVEKNFRRLFGRD